MNGLGAYVKPLLKQAKRAAKTIGAVSVDVGDTACEVPLASACIEKIESMGRIGKKRKTMLSGPCRSAKLDRQHLYNLSCAGRLVTINGA